MGSVDEIDHPIVFFDGVCNLCNGAVNFIIDNEKQPTLRFAALQSEFANRNLSLKGLNLEEMDSIVLLESNGEVYIKSKAAVKISKYLRRPLSFLYILRFIPSIISDAVYDLIARNRYSWFGKSEQCRIPTPELKNRFIDSAILS